MGSVPAISRLTPATSSDVALYFPSKIGDTTIKHPYMKIQCLSSQTSTLSDISSIGSNFSTIGRNLTGTVQDAVQRQENILGAVSQIFSNVGNVFANSLGKLDFHSVDGSAIGLYIPELQETLDPIWDQKDMMIVGNLQEAASSAAGGSIGDVVAGSGALAAILAGRMASSAVSTMAARVGADLSLADAASFLSRKTPNQKRTLLFDGMALRSFSFSWKMTPRSEDELNTIYKIVDILKLQSLPTLAANGVLFEYPNPVQITFHNVDQEKFPKIGVAVIDILRVNYTPDKALQLFSTGAPVSLQLDMSVKEIDVMVREGNTIRSSGLYGSTT